MMTRTRGVDDYGLINTDLCVFLSDPQGVSTIDPHTATLCHGDWDRT